MRHERDWLLDILDAADRIAVRVERGRRAFDTDEDLQLAMARLIENIGEACARLGSETWQRYPDVPCRAIAGMRNRVVHGYFDIDLDLVWVACERARRAGAAAEGDRRAADAA